MAELKTTFDLEPNPFERSFATKETSVSISDTSINLKAAEAGTNSGRESTSSISSSTNKHNLRIPNISNLNSSNANNNKLPGITPPPLFTPGGGRRLPPPLGMSPGGGGVNDPSTGLTAGPGPGPGPHPHVPPPPGSLSNPGTPGSSTLWNSLLSTATNHQQQQQQQQLHSQQQHNGYNHYNMIRKGSSNIVPNASGLTPNESNVRMGPGGTGISSLGLTPGGGLAHFLFGSLNAVPGLTTPGGGLLLNGPITPGLSSLLGIAPTTTSGSTSGGAANMLPPVNNANGGNNSNGGGMNATHPTIKEETYTPVVSQQQPPPQQQSQQDVGRENQGYVDVYASQETTTKQSPRKRKSSINRQDSEQATKRAKGTRGRKPKDAKTKRDNKKEEEEKENERNEGVDDTEDEKRRNFLERNRVAASKCRQRKKQLAQKMEEELAFYLAGYRELLAQVANLRNQVINLKGILVGHKDCTRLLQAVGGSDVLDGIIQQANFATQVSAGASAHENITSIPSTIPTTLNNNNQIQTQSHQQQQQQQQQQQGNMVQQPVPIVQVTNLGTTVATSSQPSQSGPTSVSVTPEMYSTSQAQSGLAPAPVGVNIVGHHSMTDLPAAAAAASANDAAMLLSSNAIGNAGNGDLRAISSMSNLAAMSNHQRQF